MKIKIIDTTTIFIAKLVNCHDIYLFAVITCLALLTHFDISTIHAMMLQAD